MILENVLTEIHKPVKFKILAFLVLSLTTFQACNQIQNILVALYSPSYSCNNSLANSKPSTDQCLVTFNGSTVRCTKWNFSSTPVGTTMVSDYELVCQNDYLKDVILICWYSSSFFGLLMGWLSDRFGRKKITLFNLCLETLFLISISFTPNVTSNIVCRFIQGISGSAVYITFVWLREIVDNEFKPFVGSFFWLYWSVGYMTFPLISFYTRNWRLTQLFSIIPSISYLAFLFIPESPRWSYVMNRKQELNETLRKIAKINQIDFKEKWLEICENKQPNGSSNLRDFKDQDFRIRVVAAMVYAMSINLLYLAMVLDLTILNKNIFLSIFLQGLLESPSIIISYFMLKHVKRKIGIMISGGIGSSFILISMFFDYSIIWQKTLRITLACIAKIAVSTCNQNSIAYTSELFPTTHRTFGLSIYLLNNFLCFIAAYNINKLSAVLPYLPMLFYFMFVWSIGIFSYFILPETKNVPIPDTVEDMKLLRVGREDEFVYYMNNKLKANESFDESDNKCSESHDENSQLILTKRH